MTGDAVEELVGTPRRHGVERRLVEDDEHPVAVGPYQGVEHAVGGGLVDEAVTDGVDQDQPTREKRFVVPVESGVEEAQPTVVAGELGVDLGAEVDRVASGSVGTDVPGPFGCGRRRVVLGQLVRGVAEAAGGDDHGAGGDLILADSDADHSAGLVEEEAVDPLAEGDVDATFATLSVQGIDDGLAGALRDMNPGGALVGGLHQLVVEVDAEVTQPVHDTTRVLAQLPHDARINVPTVHREIVVEQFGAGVLDSQGSLIARARAHDEAT